MYSTDNALWSDSKSRDGSWLCSNGPYADYIAAQCNSRPGLKYADPENSATPLHLRESSATRLTLEHTNKYSVDPDMNATQDLDVLRKQLEKYHGVRNVWLIENINRETVAILGNHFKMDPDFFLDFERTSKWRRWSNEATLTPSLPSVTATQQHRIFRFHELREFTPYIDSYNVSCANSGRFIHMMKVGGKFENPSIVDRRCAYWFGKAGAHGWDVVILCDPPLRQVHVWKQNGKDAKFYPHELALQNDTPFQGGYRDFLPHQALSNQFEGPTRMSLRDDLIYYLLNSCCLAQSRPDPHIVPLLLLQKILASQYTQLLHFTTSHLFHSERPLLRRETLLGLSISWAEARWSEIQEVMSRCNEYIDNLELLFLGLGIPLIEPKFESSASIDWWDTTLDFQVILHQAKALKLRAEGLNTAFTGLTGIVGNAQNYEDAQRSLVEAKRSVREAKNMKVLTFVAMFFIPLSFTSGLFSMSDAYIPGTGQFWVYFAVSIPLIIVVFAGAFVADLGYDEDGKWAWKWFGKGLKDAFVRNSVKKLQGPNKLHDGHPRDKEAKGRQVV